MYVRFWGTRGSIPTPGRGTAGYGGNTSCVEIRPSEDTLIVLDCGTGIRELGLELARSGALPKRIHLLIGHMHWDHIQGFPFFGPASMPATELNIYAPSGFQRGLEDSLSGQMQYSYFPVKLHDLLSRIHYTELEEGFFRIADVLVETQYLNHTAPTIAYRISSGGTTIAYATDHEPYWNEQGSPFQHPGDQRHVEFFRGADLLIHDSQYTCDEYATKRGWGHSTIEYVTDVAIAAGVSQLALFHHDPTHDDSMIKNMEDTARTRAARAGSSVDIFAAAEGMGFKLVGRGTATSVAQTSALVRRWISGNRVLLVSSNAAEIKTVEQVLIDDGLVLTATGTGKSALDQATLLSPDIVIMDSILEDGDATGFVEPLRLLLNRPDLPILLLASQPEVLDHKTAGTLATDYLPTPFSPPMLRTRIRSWLARTGTRIDPQRKAVDSGLLLRGFAGKNHVAILKSLPLFRSLTAENLESLANDSVERVFPPGHIIIRQGELGNDVYIVLGGRVRIVAALADSSVELFLGELGPGEIFGELGILRELPRSASVITLEKTSCLVMPEEEFLSALRSSADASIELMRVMAARLYDADRLLARHAPDPLTGLPGRRAFNELYRRFAGGARRRKVGVVLLALDILHLKEINDRFGYAVGDIVLRVVADALIESSRSTDLVARYGNDEFAALLLEAGTKDVEMILRRVQHRLRELALRRGIPLEVECSIGYAVSLHPPEAADELLRAADQDMQSKRVSAAQAKADASRI